MMNKTKQWLVLFLALLLVAGLFGCTKGDATPAAESESAESTVEEQEEASSDTEQSAQSDELPAMDEDAIAIHYQREDGVYENWTLWLWDPDGTDDGEEDDFNYQDDYGMVAYYPLSHFGDLYGGRLGLIVKTKGDWTKDATDEDRFIELSSFTKDEKNIYHVYLVGGDAHIYTSPDKEIYDEIRAARFDDETTVYIACSNPVESFRIYEGDDMIVEDSGAGRTRFTFNLEAAADFSKDYTLEVLFRASGDVLQAPISMTGLYASEAFNETYYYDGELGAIYTPDETTFKVWSPVSTKIALRIYENGTPTLVDAADGNDAYVEYEMEKGEKGVFSFVATGDLEGMYYTYFVTNATYPNGMEVVDPYAKSTGINGQRGMIVDFSRTNPDGWEDVPYLTYDRKALVVYETHVADVTSSETWTGSEKARRKYAGLIETGTTYTEDDTTVTTGFDHIKELGVNAI